MESVGFLGLGIMGSRMAANLRRAGHELTVYNRTAETAQAFADEHGATVASTPAEVGAASDVVITMVVDGDQVRELLLGEQGAATQARDRALFVDMSTIAPGQARAIAAELDQRGLGFVDAPVTGSSPKAQDGTLTIMAGGDDAAFARAKPLFEVMGEKILHVGETGQGQTVKLINNAVAAANASTLAQALVVGRGLGADLNALVEILAAGSGNSTMVGLKAKPMIEHDYSTLFKLEHMLKDIRLCLEEGQAAGVPFPAAAAVREQLTAGMGRGLGDADFAAILEVVEGTAGIRL